MTDADALGEVMEKYEEGSFSDVADIVIDAIIENSPEGQTFTDVDAHKSTAASGLSPMPLPINQNDWWCFLFPLLCPKFEQLDAYSVNTASGDMVDELRFDLLADAISGESTDDIVASVEEMIEEINSGSTSGDENTEARVGR